MGNERFDISIPKEYLTRDKARLLYVSSATYGGDWISTPHTHYCSELFYVIDGVGQFQVEDNIFPVSANDLVVINPNVSHTELGFNANPLKYIVLGIEGLELSVENNNANFCIVNFREIKDTVNFYLKVMLREIETRSAGYETSLLGFDGNPYRSFRTPDQFFYDSQSRKQKSIPPLRFRSALY